MQLDKQNQNSDQNSNQDLYQTTESVNFDQKQVYELARTNLDFLAALALPLITTYLYPVLYHTIWELLLSYSYRVRDFSKIAIGIPRGFAKTSLVKLYILYCILYTNKSFILILGASEGLAINILSDVADMLDEPNIKAVFGDWRNGMETDTTYKKKFGFRGRDIILAAIGQGGSVRGLNIKNRRPDVMIFDDIQTKEDAESELVSASIERWMIGTAMKAASHLGCTYIFLANMYPTEHSILKKLKRNPEWIKFIVGGLLSNSESLWEELKPKKQLIDEYIHDLLSGHPEIYLAEVLNDENANANKNLDLSLIPNYPFIDDEDIPTGAFIVVDPSNDKANSDAVAIIAVQLINAYPVVREVIEDSLSPENIIIESFKLCFKYNASVIFVESNAFQYSLCFWYKKYKLQFGLYELIIQDIYTGVRAKTSRILDMFKSLATGEILLHPSTKAQVINQIANFDHKKINNIDNVLDCITYIPKILSEYGELIAFISPFTSGPIAHVVSELENCEF